MSEKLRDLMGNWQLQKRIESEAMALRRDTEIEMYKELMAIQEIKEEGSTSYQDGDLKLTVVGRYDYKVDQKLAAENAHLFKAKFEYSKTLIKDMNDKQISLMEEMVTKTVAKPSFKVEVKEQ